MKKLLIIAVASCLFFVSCSKVNPNPGPPAPVAPQRYVITNTETNWGVVEYRVVYTDINSVVHNIPLLMGQSITVCLSNAAITTNFAHTIVAIGNC